MSFNDDEPILPTQDDSGEKIASFSEFKIVGKTKAKIINSTKAPLKESPFKVMVELIGAGFDSDRPGVDLVTVLDVSESMKGKKLAKMKLAMQFKRTNITAGLEMGLEVLDDRKLTDGRVPAIMLMSDGRQNEGDDPTEVEVSDVPIYTFGFGVNHDPTCLAGLLTVAVQDLELTLKQGKDQESKIETVSAGNYEQSKGADFVTISFGDLYNKEVRKIIVDLLLPAVKEEQTGVEIIKITHKYRASDSSKLLNGNPLVASIDRVGTTVEAEKEEVMIEAKRLETAETMKDARLMADDNKLEDAKDMLVEAQNKLQDFVVGKPNPLIEMLKFELKELVRLMQCPETYKKRGRPFALSSENSHDRQRFAARGRDVGKLRLFSTPRMDTYLCWRKNE
ncbi:hypothetical protein L484_010930 [Morus notabilis]|uniref:VWA-Hint protein Vwaint domain-containing protein n=1 Tax=Morus notabilis TaxID=981085 RepID=W9S7X7_9ROSA|nr:hypothetical protein L484_010930 [Morus notabilis]